MEISLLCRLLMAGRGRQLDALALISSSEKNLNLGLDRLFSEAELGHELGIESSLQMGQS